MKRFYGREMEISRLEEQMKQSFEDYSCFTVIVGRRRIGKTSLVTKQKQVFKGKPILQACLSMDDM